jgi:hypothetical protein
MPAPLRSAILHAVAPVGLLVSLSISSAATAASASPFAKRSTLETRASGAMSNPIGIEGSAPITGSWVRLPPPTFTEGGVAYDGSRQRLLVFGGNDDEICTNDLWELSLSGTPTWTRLSVGGAAPVPRAGHNLFYDSIRDRLLLFGGHDDASNTLNDIWQIQLGSLPLAWQQGSPPGSLPPTRAYASAIYDSVGDRVILFGGAHTVSSNGPPSDFLNDVWEIPLDVSPAWNELTPAGTPPSARAGGTVIYDSQRGRMVLFGGFDGSTSNDAFELTLGGSPQWNAIVTTGGPPPSRAVAATLDDAPNDRMVVYGGVGGDGNAALHDTWSLALASGEWTALSPGGTEPTPRDFPLGAYDRANRRLLIYGARDTTGGLVPDVACALSLDSPMQWSRLAPGAPARDRASGVYDHLGNRLVVFGGTDAAGARADVWELALASGRWSQWTVAGTPPSARAGQSTIDDPIHNRMVIFGGDDGVIFNNEVWALSLGGSPTWTQIVPVSPSGGETPSGFPTPTPRSGHSAIYDSRRDRMVVYGGTSLLGNPLSDAWSFDFSSSHWTQLDPGIGPGQRSRHAAVYDDGGDRMLLFSGQGSPNDVWELPFASGTWNQLSSSGSAPASRYGCAAVYDTAADAMLIFGGPPNGFGGWTNDTWILTLRGTPTWHQVGTTGQLPRGREQSAYGYDQVGARLVLFGGLESDDHRLSDAWQLNFDRATPVLGAMVRATARVDRVELAWNLTGAMTGVRIERRDPGADWRAIAARDVDGSGLLEYVDAAVVAGARYGYRLADRSGNALTNEEWIEVPRGASLELLGFVPNPARRDARIAFALSSAAPARVEVLDLAGRRVFARDVGSFGAGRHVLPLGDSRLEAGVYLVRLVANGRTEVTRRAVVLR